MKVRTGLTPGAWRDDGPAAASAPISMGGSSISAPVGPPAHRVRPLLAAPADFSGIVVRNSKGMLHRADAKGFIHPRCRGGHKFVGEQLSEGEAMEWANKHPNALCRYRWCFRSVLESIGIDPETGHVDRHVRLQP